MAFSIALSLDGAKKTSVFAWVLGLLRQLFFGPLLSGRQFSCLSFFADSRSASALVEPLVETLSLCLRSTAKTSFLVLARLVEVGLVGEGWAEIAKHLVIPSVPQAAHSWPW